MSEIKPSVPANKEIDPRSEFHCKRFDPMTDLPDHICDIGLKKHVDALTDYIENSATPKSLALHGGWGTGKTAVIKELVKKWKSDEKPEKKEIFTIELNAWELSQFGHSDNLPAILADSVIQKIIDKRSGEDDNRTRRKRIIWSIVYFHVILIFMICTLLYVEYAKPFVIIALSIYFFVFFLFIIHLLFRTKAEKMNKKGHILNHAKKLVPLVAVVSERLVGSVAINNFSAAYKDSINEHSKNLEERKSLLKTVVNELCNENIDNKSNEVSETSPIGAYKKICIFIDDLDRIAPIKAVEVLEVLSLFFKLENIFFVIAIDYEKISKGVEEKYGDYLNMKENPKIFFEKIFQVEFEVPVKQYNVHLLLTAGLNKIFNKNVEEECVECRLAKNEKCNKIDCYEAYRKLIEASTLKNPRAIKRLLNFYKLSTLIKKSMLDTALYDENHIKITRIVIFADLCMQSFEKFYSFLMEVHSCGYTIDLKYIKIFRSANEVRYLYDKHEVDITEEEVKRIQNFVSVFIEILDNDSNEEKQTINKNLKELYDGGSVMITPKTPYQNVFSDDLFTDSQVIRFNGREYSKLENNLSGLAIEMIKTAAKYVETPVNGENVDKRLKKLRKKIKDVDFEYKEKLKVIVLKIKIDNRPSYYQLYYYISNDELIKMDGKEYVIIKGWGTKQIHQLNRALKDELDKAFDEGLINSPIEFLPPTRG
ncbi:MAG: KAP family NTPase [Firmicutes bacterium]|nr:KAP family NTPase [Bacillota bacterium]